VQGMRKTWLDLVKFGEIWEKLRRNVGKIVFLISTPTVGPEKRPKSINPNSRIIY